MILQKLDPHYYFTKHYLRLGQQNFDRKKPIFFSLKNDNFITKKATIYLKLDSAARV